MWHSASGVLTIVLKKDSAMDQIKIGKFISERRRAERLTQAALAEKLGITDRAVSKWECGRSLPDASIMIELCRMLQITVNDLLSGEIVSMENYNEEMEKNLLNAIKEKEEADKRLLSVEVILGAISTVFLLVMFLIAFLLNMSSALRTALIILGVLLFIPGVLLSVRIEQVAGYYECQKCHNRYVPDYMSVNLAPHMGRTRYMRCPECMEKSWQKKVLSK